MVYVNYPVNLHYSGYFVGWGTLALLNAAIAQLQGRSALLWFFLSLFFGPIATFFLLITYLGENGQLLSRIPFYAAIEKLRAIIDQLAFVIGNINILVLKEK